jgi:hypothetical protein
MGWKHCEALWQVSKRWMYDTIPVLDDEGVY